MKLIVFFTTLSYLLVSSSLYADTLRVYNLGELLLDYDVSKYPKVMERIQTVNNMIEGADVVVGNLETAIQPKGLSTDQIKALYKNPSARVVHHTPDSAVDILSKNLQVNLFSLANNHSFDLGHEGILTGLSSMNQKGLTHAGTGYNHAEATGYRLLHKGDKTIAFFAFTNITLIKDNKPLPRSIPTRDSAGLHYIPGTSHNWQAQEKNHLLNAIRSLKEKNIVDYIFVSGHIHYTSKNKRPWGANGIYPTDISKAVIDAGADAFFIEGPHAPKGFEVYKHKPIFYGVGNLIFNTRKNVGEYKDYRWYSYITDTIFKNKQLVAMRIIPLIANDVGLYGDHTDPNEKQLHWETRGFGVPVTGADAQKVLEYIAQENKASEFHDFTTHIDIQGDFAYWPDKASYQKALVK